ncbi:PREDICTED: uncharacterized protein LOC108750963 [Trachymyrmex septentrionalis]|uniref:uncharacterized protein LOC108750963 n=1 Tax=Trachymyrmex septentrionalis TaxID=34720 RepID=UPI00084F47A5|nr:PREDICTED: uncharacterized protein LOC108750963 [Trachymyrmex septentrionalis]
MTERYTVDGLVLTLQAEIIHFCASAVFTRTATRARSNSAREIQNGSRSLLRVGHILFRISNTARNCYRWTAPNSRVEEELREGSPTYGVFRKLSPTCDAVHAPHMAYDRFTPRDED